MTQKSAYILVVDDEPDIRSLLKEILEDEGYEVGVAEDGTEARRARRARRPDLVLLDIWMPGADGITLLKEWNEETSPAPPVIMMSGHGTVETAIEATRLGAWDFIEKPLSLGKLLVTVQRALEAYRLRQEREGLLNRVRPATHPLGRSQAMNQLREQVQRVAQHDAPVLIQGEAGSGKGAIALYLHAHSSRSEGPFIEVGIGSLASGNPEAELFGLEEGERIHFGLLERANGGTLFLDDVADVDPATQARLLGALESGRYYRVGGKESVEANVRFVAGTRSDLEERVQEERFRADLYYKLNVVPIHVPPLRDHAEDIPELLAFYVDYFVTHDTLAYRAFTVAAQNRLRHYSWPGNVRELQNLVQRLLIVGNGTEIDVGEVEAALPGIDSEAASLAEAHRLPLREARERFERHYFSRLLEQLDGSMVRIAQHAGIERTHLYRKLRALDLDSKGGSKK